MCIGTRHAGICTQARAHRHTRRAHSHRQTAAAALDDTVIERMFIRTYYVCTNRAYMAHLTKNNAVGVFGTKEFKLLSALIYYM